MNEMANVTVAAESADWLAEFTRRLVDDRLAACGNIIPQIRSVYTWEGKTEDGNEALVLLHTRQSLVPRIIERANAEHPDDTPQVIALPVSDANPAYREWLLDVTDASHETTNPE